MTIVGREKELLELEKLYQSNKPEFLAIYGRRRVGKTYLVYECFQDRFAFYVSALSPVDNKNLKPEDILHNQLNNFYNALKKYGLPEGKKPQDWFEAFNLLSQLLDLKDDGHTKKVVFLDELPWFDTKGSNFISAFESFWNQKGSHDPHLLLIVCGSANSWMLDELINSRGGLYNRVTYEIHLQPFNLKECEELLKLKNIKMSSYDLAQTYMIFGGVPYYLNYLNSDLSLIQNVDELFFSNTAKLANEYERLFSSMFKDANKCKDIVTLLAKRNYGYTRKEICEKLHLSSGESLSQTLNALVASDLVMKYSPYRGNKRDTYYRLIDPLCIFHLSFVKDMSSLTPDFFQGYYESPAMSGYRGKSFENLCFAHISAIKKTLGINGIISTQGIWYQKGNNDVNGHQCDLIIDRNDNIVNLVEAKFYRGLFTVNKDYYFDLLDREEEFSKIIEKRKITKQVLLTTFGLKNNEYSSIFSNVITIDDLIKNS